MMGNKTWQISAAATLKSMENLIKRLRLKMK